MRFALKLALIATLSIVVGGCGSSDAPEEGGAGRRSDAIVVGSFDFSESRVLAEVYAQGLRARGFPAEVADLSAPREILAPAVAQGFVDLVPEYLGTALTFVTFEAPVVQGHLRPARRSLAARLAARGIEVLRPATAENKNEVVVRAGTAARFDLETISDLAEVDEELTFGGPPECPQRPLCLEGLEDVYGLGFASFVPLDAGGPLTVAALVGREIDVGVLFTTDPAIESDGFVVLEDDRELQPPENIVPVVRAAKLEKFGSELERSIDEITRHLDDDALRDLNARVVEQGLSPSRSAELWLALERLT